MATKDNKAKTDTKNTKKTEKKEPKTSTPTTTKLSSHIAVGLKRGHVLTKRKATLRPSRRKGHAGKGRKLAKEVVRDVAGFAPYEKRLLELLRNGLEKRALKLAKKKLGTHLRAKRKFNEMQDAIRKIREQRQKEIAEQKKD